MSRASARLTEASWIWILATLIAATAILSEGSIRTIHGQDHAVADSTGQADSLIAQAREELGLASTDTVGDFTDVEGLSRQIRILTKQLAATGEFSKVELSDIKVAGLDAEEALRRNGGRSNRQGRVIMLEWLETIEVMASVH